jgi:DNA-binding transcriptional MerR regulator
MVVGMWTLDELVDRVRGALAAEYPGAPNNRVRDLPDRRAVRWYTTIGLVDRPLGMRGRSALYGPRHLVQLAALKRRQAEGRTLAEIQAELAGASDAVLATVARVPDSLLIADGPAPEPPGPARTRFWAAAPATAAPEATPEAAPMAASEAATVTRAPAAAVGGVALGGGAILVLPGLPADTDRAAIAAAARPLMALLAERGLLNTDDGSAS